MRLHNIPKLSALITLAFLGSESNAMAKPTAVTPVPQVVTAAVAEMLVMFQNRDVAQQSAIIRERYATNAIFTDPLMKVSGHKDVALEFYSLIKIFESVNIQQKELKVTEGAKEGVYQADVENHQTYVPRKQGFFSKHLMPDKVELDVTTKLEVQKESGKILSHVEVWHDKFVPVPGFLKPVNGGLSALWFKILGWGKDVSDSAPTTNGQSATQ